MTVRASGDKSSMLDDVFPGVQNRHAHVVNPGRKAEAESALRGRKSPQIASWAESLLESVAAALDHTPPGDGGVRITVEITPAGESKVFAVEPIAGADKGASEAPSPGDIDRALAAARERGRPRVAEILSGNDMLSADEMAKLLATTRMTVNTRRRNHQLLGLEGAKRGVRYPQWQIGEDGRPFEVLPALFERFGGSPWAVYRFLAQRHAELGGLTGREALERGRAAQALEAAESIAAGAFS